jgi:hypothetical protein
MNHKIYHLLQKIVSTICTILVFLGLFSGLHKYLVYSAEKEVNEFYQGISIGSSIDTAVDEAENRGFNIRHSSEEIKAKHSGLEGLIAVKSIFPRHIICFLAHKDKKVQAKRFMSAHFTKWTDKSQWDR